MKFKTRQTRDPYSGRGIELYAMTEKTSYTMGASIGLSENLIAFRLTATPPFEVKNINEGEDNYDDDIFKTLGITVSFMYLRLEVSFNRFTGWLHSIYDEEEVPPRPSLSLV